MKLSTKLHAKLQFRREFAALDRAAPPARHTQAGAMLCETMQGIYDLHAGREGAAAEFLEANGGKPGMADYFTLWRALPVASGRFALADSARAELLSAFGPAVGELLLAEIRQHPTMAHTRIAQLFVAKKAEVLALLNAEIPDMPACTAPATPVAPRIQPPLPASACRPDISHLAGHVRVKAAWLWQASQDPKRRAFERKDAAERFEALMKAYAPLQARASAAAKPR